MNLKAPRASASATAAIGARTAVLCGPLNDSKTLKFRASVNAYNTDGYLENEFLHQKADPAKDFSGRVRLTCGEPNDPIHRRFAPVGLAARDACIHHFVIPRE